MHERTGTVLRQERAHIFRYSDSVGQICVVQLHTRVVFA